MKVKLLKPYRLFKFDKEMPAGAVVAIENVAAQGLIKDGIATDDLNAALPVDEKKKQSTPKPE